MSALMPHDRTGTVLQAVVARELSLPPESLTGELRLSDDLGLDGASAIDIVIAMEQALDIRFPDDFLDGLLTYGDLSRAVRVAVG